VVTLQPIIYLTITWILAYSVSLIPLIKKRLKDKGITIYPFIFIWRLSKGEKLVKIGIKRVLIWSTFGYLALFYSLGLAFFGFYFLGQNLIRLLYPHTGQASPVVPIIPGVTINFTADEFVIFLLIVGIILVTHEMAHAIIASARGIKVKWVGFALFAFFPAGFVEIDEESANKASKIDRLLTFSAGTFINFLTWAIFLILLLNIPLLWAWGYSTQPQGIVISEVLPNTPASQMNLQPGQIIVALNGTPIKNTQDLINYLKHTIPNQTLIVTLKIDDTLKNITLKLAANPNNQSRGMIGIGSYDYYPSKFNLDPILPYWIQLFVSWGNLISLSVAIFNSLPIPGLDGDKIFYEILNYKKSIFSDTAMNILRAIAIVLLISNMMFSIRVI
jgi:membrane-associated protease RseP (regulator of RpoE activity)